MICPSANYIHWRFVKDLGGYTTQQMIDLAFAFSSVLYGTSQPEARFVPILFEMRMKLKYNEIITRSTTCANQANNLVGFATGAKYVERAFDEAAKTEVFLRLCERTYTVVTSFNSNNLKTISFNKKRSRS